MRHVLSVDSCMDLRLRHDDPCNRTETDLVASKTRGQR